MKRFFLAAICFVLTFSAVAAEQAVCPIMIDTEIDTQEVVDYRGTKLYMCCAACATAWEINPDYYAVAAASLTPETLKEHKLDGPLLPQLEGMALPKVKLLKQRFCAMRKNVIVAPESPFIEYEGQKIYFFRNSDVRRWNRDPEANFQKAREAGVLPQFDPEENAA